MSHEDDIQMMEALADARRLVNNLRLDVAASNSFAWNKLDGVSTYLGNEQIILGCKMFADPEAENVLAAEMAT